MGERGWEVRSEAGGRVVVCFRGREVEALRCHLLVLHHQGRCTAAVGRGGEGWRSGEVERSNLRSFPAVQWTSIGEGGAAAEPRWLRMARNGSCVFSGEAAAARMVL